MLEGSRNLGVRFWEKMEDVSQYCGVNPLVLAVLFVSVFVWLPIAPFLPIPIWLKGVVASALYLSFWVYAGFGVLRKLLVQDREFVLELQPFSPEAMGGWEEIAALFRKYWSPEPWGEYLRCEVCARGSGGTMYDQIATWSYEEAQAKQLGVGSECPTCGSPLALYWNACSARKYFEEMRARPDYRGILAFIDGDLAGWHFSYERDGAWYLDTIALLRPHSRNLHRRHSLLSAAWRQMVEARRRGYTKTVVRMPDRALHTKLLAQLFEYQRVAVDPRDPTRAFWEAKLDWLNLVWLRVKLGLVYQHSRWRRLRSHWRKLRRK